MFPYVKSSNKQLSKHSALVSTSLSLISHWVREDSLLDVLLTFSPGFNIWKQQSKLRDEIDSGLLYYPILTSSTYVTLKNLNQKNLWHKEL